MNSPACGLFRDGRRILARPPRTVFPRAARRLLAGVALLAALGTPGAAKEEWDPVAPADLAATASVATPGADLEYLLRRSYLVDEDAGTVFRHYVRVKVYTPRGVENAGTLSIEYPDNTDIRHLAARVVKTNGTTVDLRKSDFIDGTLLKQGDVKWKKTSFVFPNLAPGDLVEYRWTEDTHLGTASLWTYCQWDAPVREFKFTIEASFAKMNVSWYNVGQVARNKRDDDTLELTIHNIPPFVEEDHMIAERDWRGWIRLVYVEPGKTVEQAWKEYGRAAHEFFIDKTAPNGALRKKAAELTAGAQTDEEKLRRLYDFCQKEIMNLSWDEAPEAREARRKGGTGEVDAARQILKRRRGWTNEITYLFGGLARAAGYDARRAQNAPGTDLLRVRRIPRGWDFMKDAAVAIQLNGRWTFYAPGEAFVPFGMRHRLDEGTLAMICDPHDPIYEVVPVSPAVKTLTVRKGRFTLDEGGELSGEVEETFTGHAAVSRKILAADEGQEKVDSDFKTEITKLLPTAEVTDIRWENLRSNVMPVIVRFTIRVPGYADQVGQRLVVRPAFFEAGAPAVFTAAKRTYPIAFTYAWTEKDDVEVKVPETFELENAAAPADVRARSDLQTAEYTLAYKPARHTLAYTRDYMFGGEGSIVFTPESYELLKFLFERAHLSDVHSVVLKPRAKPAPADAPAPVAKPATVTP